MSLSEKQMKTLSSHQEALSQIFNVWDVQPVVQQFTCEFDIQACMTASLTNRFNVMFEKIIQGRNLPAVNEMVQMLYDKGKQIRHLCTILRASISENAQTSAKDPNSPECPSSSSVSFQKGKPTFGNLQNKPESSAPTEKSFKSTIPESFVPRRRKRPRLASTDNANQLSASSENADLTVSPGEFNENPVVSSVSVNVKQNLPRSLPEDAFSPLLGVTEVPPVICTRIANHRVDFDALAKLLPQIYANCWRDLWNFRRSRVDLPLLVFPQEVFGDGGPPVVLCAWFDVSPNRKNFRLMVKYADDNAPIRNGTLEVPCRVSLDCLNNRIPTEFLGMPRYHISKNNSSCWLRINMEHWRGKLNLKVAPVITIRMYSTKYFA